MTRPVLRDAGLCVVVAVGAALGAATGAVLGAGWNEVVLPVAELVAPSARLDQLFAHAIAVLVGSFLGAFVELGAIFKGARVGDPDVVVAVTLWLGLVGVIGLWVRVEAGGDFSPALFPMACLPAALLLALASGTRWVANRPYRGRRP